jgi:choice-of-anchor B domain-containing protein
MKQLYTLFFTFLSVLSVNAQDNFNLALINNTIIPEDGSDIWGWVDGNGTEYAIMGGRSNTWIWSLEDPANPIQRAQIPGDASIWRDIKSWEDHVYVTTDSGDDGLLIIDMSMAPDSISSHYITPDIIARGDTTALGPCHNLYIDEKGFCYLAGCRVGGANKAIIFDLNQDKWNPPVVGVHGDVPGAGGYAHDLYVKNNIMYSSEINEGLLSIYDCSRKDSLIVLGTKTTSFNFTHNAWSSTDQNYVFTTDERANAYVDAYDVSDPSNIVLLDKFQPLETQNLGVIPHNTHYYDGYLVTSYYTDGVVITDVTKPDNMIKVGSYDTFSGPHGGFSGCWGAYPYLPSGRLLVSDINSGLYIFEPNYVRAARLEGTVTDAMTGNPVNNAELIINAEQVNLEYSDATGSYKTGIAEQGLLELSVVHPDYEAFTTEVELINGETTLLDIALNPIQREEYRITVVDAASGELVPNAHVVLASEVGSEEFFTNEFGEVVELLPIRNYSLRVAAWSYRAQQINIQGNTNSSIQVALERGYYDSFELDQGWMTSSTAVSGVWERGIPNGTISGGEFFAPPTDSDDEGESCYVTGNADTNSAAQDDIDNGFTELTSPAIDLSDMEAPHLQFSAWYATGGGSGPSDDTMFVYLNTVTERIELAQFIGNTFGWGSTLDFDLTEYINSSGDFLSVSFLASDNAENGHLVEAGIDAFEIVEMNTSSTEDLSGSPVNVYPNPFIDNVRLDFPSNVYRKINIYDALGRNVYSLNSSAMSVNIEFAGDAGIYTLKVVEGDGKIISQQIVKK